MPIESSRVKFALFAGWLQKLNGRVRRLRDEAVSIEHRIFHSLKHHFATYVRRKPRDPDVNPDDLVITLMCPALLRIQTPEESVFLCA